MNLPKILVVDDEKEIRDSYRTILTTEDLDQKLDKKASSLFATKEKTESQEFDDLLGEEDDDFMIVEEDFGSNNYEIVEASQGMEAVEIIESSLAQKQPFSIVFMDVRMPPGIDGVEAAKMIRALDRDIEIVIMTAYTDYNLEEIVEKIGNPDRLLYFHKPFHSEQIKNLASSLTQHWYLERKQREQD